MYSQERIDKLSQGFNVLETIAQTEDLADRYMRDKAAVLVEENTWQYEPLIVMQKTPHELPLLRRRADQV